MTLYIIDPAQKFNGEIIGSMTSPDNITPLYVDYSGYLHNNGGQNLTFEEYKKVKGNENLKALTWEEIEPLYNDYKKGLQGEWQEITEDVYFDMLECLPPQKWHDLRHTSADNVNGRFNSFYISEAYTADLHSFYIKDRKTGKYYTALRSRFIKDDELINQLISI